MRHFAAPYTFNNRLPVYAFRMQRTAGRRRAVRIGNAFPTVPVLSTYSTGWPTRRSPQLIITYCCWHHCRQTTTLRRGKAGLEEPVPRPYYPFHSATGLTRFYRTPMYRGGLLLLWTVCMRAHTYQARTTTTAYHARHGRHMHAARACNGYQPAVFARPAWRALMQTTPLPPRYRAALFGFGPRERAYGTKQPSPFAWTTAPGQRHLRVRTPAYRHRYRRGASTTVASPPPPFPREHTKKQRRHVVPPVRNSLPAEFMPRPCALPHQRLRDTPHEPHHHRQPVPCDDAWFAGDDGVPPISLRHKRPPSNACGRFNLKDSERNMNAVADGTDGGNNQQRRLRYHRL